MIEYVPQVMEEIEGSCAIDPTGACSSAAHREQIVHVPVPQVVEETARVVQIIPRSVSRNVTSTESSMSQL